MKIDFTKDNGVLNVALDGRLDTTTALHLKASFANIMTARAR